MKSRRVVIDDLMQKNYAYLLTESMGKGFDADFRPDLTPSEMLRLGVFGGQYMTDCRAEFPPQWFENAKLSPTSRRRLELLRRHSFNPCRSGGRRVDILGRSAGWFQWYCRYFPAGDVPMTSVRSSAGGLCAGTWYRSEELPSGPPVSAETATGATSVGHDSRAI